MRPAGLGVSLVVPTMEKVGQLRPEHGCGGGALLLDDHSRTRVGGSKRGDRVDVVIGPFQAKNSGCGLTLSHLEYQEMCIKGRALAGIATGVALSTLWITGQCLAADPRARAASSPRARRLRRLRRRRPSRPSRI